MCGIAGILSGARPVNDWAVEAMTASMDHRGPDGTGQWRETDGRVVLGHRRLAIICTGDEGRQPMATADGALVVVHNGEIYNYLELRARLQAMGARFATASDTEVILEAYRAWGDDCVRELNGMFAFALWDRRRRRLFCARDRFGEKPFLYAHGDGYFAFASEYKALLSLDSISCAVDPASLVRFIADPRRGLDSDGGTVFPAIRQLLPGERLSLDLDSLTPRTERYWRLQPTVSASDVPDEASAADRLRELLTDSVRLRLRSDVPLGSCLSGGLDSSAIVCIGRNLMGDNTPYHTFTGRFPGTAADEWPFAETIIRHVGATAHVTEPTAKGLLADLESFVWLNELPVGSTSQYAQWCVFRLARETGITVLLDGQGGDEILAGYEQYFAAYLRGLARDGDRDRLKREGAAIRARYPLALSGWAERGKKMMPLGAKRLLSRLTGKGSDPRLGLSREALRLAGGAPQETPPDLHHALHEDAFDLHLPTLLRYGDRNSMAHSREVRLPFCDHRIAEFVFSLPPEYLMGGAETKRLLRRALRGVLPDSIRERWNKQGFRPPQENWFKGELLAYARDTVNDPAFAARGLWDAAWWQTAVERLEKGESHLAWSLWMPMIVEAWFRHFVDRARNQPKHSVFS